MKEKRTTYHHNNLKEALISEGLLMIHEEGMGALTLRKLAARVGVSAAACYNHFKNAKELFEAMTEYVIEEFARALRQAAEEDPYHCITISMGCAYVKFFAESPHYFSLLYDSRDLGIEITKDAVRSDGSFAPFGVFEEGARKEFKEKGIPEKKFRDSLLVMWATAHGFAAMANMKGIRFEGDWVQLTETIMKEKVTIE